jgi:hypothetical protein
MESLKEVDLPCCTIEDEDAVHEDETITHVEDTQVLKAPAQEETISYPPPQNFDDALLYDEGNEEEINESLNVSSLACYDTDSDIVDNIDEFIHVGKRKWDVIGYDGDPIYDIEGHSQKLPLHLSHEVTNNFDIWQQEPDLIQTPKDDLILCFPNDFRSYLEDFDDCSSEHLDLFYEDDYQPPLCSSFDRSKNVVCLKKDSHDIFLQPPLITLPCCIIKGVVGNYIFCIEFPLKQTQESKGWLKTTSLSLSSQPNRTPCHFPQTCIAGLYNVFELLTRVIGVLCTCLIILMMSSD